ncbi:ankyrin [Xylaria grammica]|nr:ankyrin [Xylaria grammica]
MTESSSPEPGVRHTGHVHPTGMTVLYVPSCPIVDICFVHGFTGHPERTWRSKKRMASAKTSIEKFSKRVKLSKFLQRSQQRDDLSESSSVLPITPEPPYWPRDLLPDVIPRARVLTFGYDTNIRHSLNGPISQNRLGDHATDFLSALDDCRSQCPNRPLIFVAHSLGGLLVKDVLRLSKSYEDTQPDRYNVYGSTTSLLFFGTPHAGADPRNAVHKVLTNIVKATGFRVNEQIVQTLMPGAERSKLLADDFLKWTNERDWNVYTFQEEFVHSALGAKIVDDHSSCIDDPRHEIKVHIRANHVDMCRFTSAGDTEFRKVSSALLRAQQSLPTNPPSNAGTDASHESVSPQVAGPMLSPEKRDMILESLSFPGIDARYMTLKNAQRRTCQWILKHHIYKAWIDSSQLDQHHGFLWIKGKPGTGKSISMKFLHQKAVSKADRIVLKFFFNARGTKLEHSTEGLYRSLLWQLISALPPSNVNSYALSQLRAVDDTASWPVEALKDAFGSVLAKASSHDLYCFVDALDECAEEEIRDMISFFEEIGENAVLNQCRIRVCFSSRHYPHITISRGLQLVLEDEDDHSRDIRDYIGSQLKIDHNRREIEEEIFNRSSRIFLWAALVVDILNKENDRGGDTSVRQRLRQIPQGLHDLFHDILTRDTENIPEMILCIQWILFAKRPLRREELYFAIRIGRDPDACTIWDQTMVPMTRIDRFNLNASKGLSEVTKKDATVQFIHESVRDYLLRERGLETLLNFQTPGVSLSGGASHDTLRDICLKQIHGCYMAQNSTEDESRWSSMPFLQYAITHILAHADSAQSEGSEQIDFLTNIFPREAWVSLDNKLQKYKSRHHSKKVDLLYLLAEQNLASLIRIHPKRHDSFIEPKEKERFPSPLAAAIAFGNNEAVLALAFEAAKGSLTTDRVQELNQVEMELRKMPRLTSDLKNSKWGRMNPLYLFCLIGSVTLLDALFNQIIAVTTIDPQELLSKAKCITSPEIDVYLIQRGARVNTITFTGETALEKAVKADELTTAEFLLMNGADPNLPSHFRGFLDLRCLDIAKSSSMMVLLIRHGAQFTDTPNGRKVDRPVHSTLCGGAATVQCLLDLGADPNMAADNGDTPLILAIRNGNNEIIRMLCQVNRANVNVRGKEGRTPLHAATLHKGAATYLLDLGADPNRAADNGDTPLLIAAGSFKCSEFQAFFGGTSMSLKCSKLRTLLQHASINVNLPGSGGETPIHRAAIDGAAKAVELLLSHPSIDTNVDNYAGFTPLHTAAKGKSNDVVRLLLAHPSTNVNPRDNDGRTPLLLAARHSPEDIVRIMLADPRIDRTAKCQMGYSVLDYAKKNWDRGVLRCIEEMQ